MATRINQSTYKDIPAITLESDALKACFLPHDGGKMASLIDKRSGREFLAQDPGPAYRRLPYAGNYVDAECSGFDDMFPTIDRMIVPDYPWAGAEMPDHGEVCALPWQAAVDDDALILTAHGVRFPYVFQKRIKSTQSAELTFDYHVRNCSPFDFNCLWAAHLMLNSAAGGRIVLPYREGSPATCVFSGDAGLGRRGDPWTWPIARRQDGRTQDLAVTLPRSAAGNSYKFYFDQVLPEGWVAYHYPDDQATFTMQFPPAIVPWLGVWINEGSFHDLYNIALEICTAPWDRPDEAAARGRASILPAGGEWRWSLKVSV